MQHALGIFLALVALSPSARAYVRTTTNNSGVGVQWNVACIAVTPDGRGSQDVPMDQIMATLQRAVGNWTSKTGACPGLNLQVQPPRGTLDVGQDGINAVVFRNTQWAAPGKDPHDPAAIGLTTVVYVDNPGHIGDGTILDADIELNDVFYTLTTDPANATARPGTSLVDLESTLTHELGHVQGLAHTCWDHITATPPLDNEGNPIPDCNGPLPTSIVTTTMYPYYGAPGDTTKRNLSSDDVKGVCDVYAPFVAKLSCWIEVDGGYHTGCAIAPSRARAWPTLALALLAIAWLTRRRVASRGRR